MDDLTWYAYEALVQAYDSNAIAFTKEELTQYRRLQNEVLSQRPTGGEISEASINLINSGGTWIELSEYDLQH